MDSLMFKAAMLLFCCFVSLSIYYFTVGSGGCIDVNSTHSYHNTDLGAYDDLEDIDTTRSDLHLQSSMQTNTKVIVQYLNVMRSRERLNNRCKKLFLNGLK